MLLILNDVAGSEILLILVFVLIFFGAKSIPGLARTLGRTIRQVKDASAEIQNEIKKSGKDMKNDLNLKGIIEETVEDIKRPLDQHASDLDSAIKYQAPKRKPIVPVKEVNSQSTESSVPQKESAPEQKEEPKESDDSKE